MNKKLLAGVLFVMTTSTAAFADVIQTESTSNSTSKSETTVKSPPPTAVAPAVTTINNDVCAVAASGAVQTQILGMSFGGTIRDMNCERIKLSKNLYDMGMKVAAVATLCQDDRVFQAMLDAGTPCPVEGKIGAQAKEIWMEERPELFKRKNAKQENTAAQTTEPLKTAPGNCGDYKGNDQIIKSRLGCE
jgi:hypothetical protein